jgi:hypothetical protein
MIEYFVSDLSGGLDGLDVPILAVSSLPAQSDPRAKEMRDSWVETYAKLPRAKLAFFYESGEFLTEDSPEELDRAIGQFLAGEPVEGKVPRPKKPEPSKETPPKPAEPK